jgi:hypothetical protein
MAPTIPAVVLSARVIIGSASTAWATGGWGDGVAVTASAVGGVGWEERKHSTRSVAVHTVRMMQRGGRRATRPVDARQEGQVDGVGAGSASRATAARRAAARARVRHLKTRSLTVLNE